ncbi:hypothetical protein RND81_09G031900 [Saponaria officinalis]|uniref:Uncharacterized protein n=1 Tax=Saponaria officinalis TaxID=3572 RepID=A0AAW1IHF1_SAPOF
MKFILEYVTCCIISTPCETKEPPPSGTRRRRRRTPARGSTVDWRPSLFAIAENNAVAVAAVEMKKKESVRQPMSRSVTRNVNRCGVSSGRVNGSPNRAYEYRRDPLPIVIPAFSAAPFMF